MEEKKRGIYLILKPDTIEYNPFQLLKYDAEEHIFYPNFENYKEEICNQIEEMILVLGINCDFIKMQRKKYLSEIMEWSKINSALAPNQFVTAYEMLRTQFIRP